VRPIFDDGHHAIDVAYALLGAVMIGGLLYVTMSAEAEEPPKANQPDPKQ
jgi:hypothetical protein